ncbi:ABC transporter permease subunit [Serratia inhibens]|uniref:ABC transporter permease subunit n=1 Tax=Serratia inhibens TaxID=2338073 RepID=A0AA93BWY8_9GAMM|nr:ABC transporter permease subunit [Serratia inhibens]RJF57599.1 ABC transporter permease subunit [Serratia inhibens]
MVIEYLPLLAHGAALSLCVMLVSLAVAVALALGLINALIKLFGPRWLRWLSTGYTTLVRGIPELVIMLLLFFGGEMLVNGFLGLLGLGPLRFNTFISGVLAIGFVFGAYYTETFRGAFLTVERGQLEAAMAYGMRPGQVFRRVLLPQMLSFAIPGINNNWLGLMKASALVSILGLEDMVWLAEQAGRATQKPFLFYFLVALIYMVITAISSWGFSLLARRYALASSTAAGAR